MRMITLVARAPLTYRGRAVRPGEVFAAAPIDAAVLTYSPSLGRPAKARFAPPGARVVAPDVPLPEIAAVVLDPDPVEEEPEEKPRRRRTYRRRDLVAEED